MDTFPRFVHLWEHAKCLINYYGANRTVPDSSIFTQAEVFAQTQSWPSTEAFARSLATAQDLVLITPPKGVAKDEIEFFNTLWDATTDVLEKALGEANLSLEVYAWGIAGLAAGYKAPSSTSASNTKRFMSYKARLKAALKCLPSLSSPFSSPHSGVTPARQTYILTKARREVHICSSILIQQVKEEGWKNINWYHGVAVAERWIGNLALVKTISEREYIDDVLGVDAPIRIEETSEERE